MYPIICNHCGESFKMTAHDEQLMEALCAQPPGLCKKCRKAMSREVEQAEAAEENNAVIYTQ